MSTLLSKTLLCGAAFLSVMTTSIGAQSALAQTAHGIAAVVNDGVITTYDVRQRTLFMMATQGIPSNEETQKRVWAQATRALIDEKLQLQEAKKYELEVSDAAINHGVQELISSNGISVDEFARRLAGAGISISTLKDQVHSDIVWQRLISGVYRDRIRISDAQIDETLNRVSANASKPSYRVGEIYIEASPDIGGMEGALQGATAMIQQLNQGAPFQTLAQQFSSSPSAAKGGDMGWLHEGELREELNVAIAGLGKGEISAPITVPGGVYVIAVMDIQTSEAETFYTLKSLNYAYSDTSELPAARTAIKTASEAFKTCDTIAADTSSIAGVSNNNMGELKSGDLTEDILALLSNTNVGEVSEPMETGAGLVALAVCKRQMKGSNIPTRDQVENRLLSQQEAQASKRHLRDLRRNATIVTR